MTRVPCLPSMSSTPASIQINTAPFHRRGVTEFGDTSFDAYVRTAFLKVIDIIKKIPSKVEKCTAVYKEAWSRRTVRFTPTLVDCVEKSAIECEYSHKRMYSGPGHDAQYIIDVIPATMIFVPSVGGHSHCELEYTPVEACLKGANVLLRTLLHIDAQS